MLRGPAIATLLLAATSSGFWAQKSVGSPVIQGIVRDSSGLPVPGASIRLDKDASGATENVLTDAKGAYRLTVAGSGSFRLRAEKPGYQTTTLGPLDLAPGQTRTLDLTLTPASSGTTPSAAAQFYDEPQFTVAGVADIANHGGHGSDTVSRTVQALAKDVTLAHKAESQAAESSTQEQTLRAALAERPDYFETNHRLGTLLEKEGKPAQALPFLERAHSSQPADYSTSLSLAEAYARTGEMAKAEQTAHSLLPAHDSAELHHLLGDIEEKQGQSLKAVQDYQRAAELDPSEPNLFDWGAELLLHRAVEPALQVFSKGSRLHPDSARMLVGLGVAQYASGSPALAAQTLCRASDLDPQNPYPYLVLGRMQALDPPGSPIVTEKMERFVRLHPENSLANFYCAVSLQRQAPTELEKLNRIESFLKRSIELDPNFAAAYLQLGVVHETQKQLPVAISDYQRALAVDPQLAEAHYRLAQAYRRTGEKAQAEQELALSDQISKQALEKAEQDNQQIPQFVYTLRHPEPPSH
jgi:tetratricopeptide (TPR) repeat protein